MFISSSFEFVFKSSFPRLFRDSDDEYSVFCVDENVALRQCDKHDEWPVVYRRESNFDKATKDIRT